MRKLIIFFAIALATCQVKSQVPPIRTEISNGYISATGYTNSYFGFHLPTLAAMQLKGPVAGPVTSQKSSTQFLFSGRLSEKQGLTVLLVSVGTLENTEGKLTSIAGKDFYVHTDQKRTPFGENFVAIYRTRLGEYTLTIAAMSYSKSAFVRVQSCVESMTFFDPTKSRDQAGSDAVAVSVPTQPSANP